MWNKVKSAELRKVNPNYERIFKLLIAKYYRRQWDVFPENTRSLLECWTGPRGVVLVQAWTDGGTAIYSGEGVPTHWTELDKWLDNK